MVKQGPVNEINKVVLNFAAQRKALDVAEAEAIKKVKEKQEAEQAAAQAKWEDDVWNLKPWQTVELKKFAATSGKFRNKVSIVIAGGAGPGVCMDVAWVVSSVITTFLREDNAKLATLLAQVFGNEPEPEPDTNTTHAAGVQASIETSAPDSDAGSDSIHHEEEDENKPKPAASKRKRTLSRLLQESQEDSESYDTEGSERKSEGNAKRQKSGAPARRVSSQLKPASTPQAPVKLRTKRQMALGQYFDKPAVLRLLKDSPNLSIESTVTIKELLDSNPAAADEYDLLIDLWNEHQKNSTGKVVPEVGTPYRTSMPDPTYN
jgi:hypothetical protein